MDCFNFLCPLHKDTTNNCECLACPNRCQGPVTYTASNHTLTDDKIVAARTRASTYQAKREPILNLTQSE